VAKRAQNLSYAEKGIKTMGKEAKCIKIADVEAAIPPNHTKSYTWGMATKENVGAEFVNVFVSEIEAGGTADRDIHPECEQLNFVLSGRAKAVVEGKEFLMEPNSCLYIPPNSEHTMENIGKETFRTLVIFSPPLKR